MTGIRLHMATALTTCLLFLICTCCVQFKTSEASPQEGRWPGEHHWDGHRGRRMGGHRGHGRGHDPPGLSRSGEYWRDDDEPPPPPPPGWGRGRGHRNRPPPHGWGNGPPPRDWRDGNRPPPPPPEWDERHRPPPPEWDDRQRPPPPEWNDRHRPPPPEWDERHRPPPPEWDDKRRPPPSEWGNDNSDNDRATPQTPDNPFSVISPTPPPPNSGDTLIVGKNPPPLPVPLATDKPDPYWSNFGRSEEVSRLRNIIFPNSLEYVQKPIEVESNQLIDVRRR